MGTLNNINLMRTLGMASTIGLLSLACFIISPPVTEGVNAEEITSSGAVSYAAVVNPVLSIALDSNVKVELSPTVDGDFKNSAARLSVSTNNTSGYRIMMGSGDASNSLTSPDGGTIPSITGTVSSGSFPKDQWGYSLTIGSEAASNYSAIPTATTDIKKVDTGDVTAGLVDDYTLNFGTKVTPSIPAGVYSKTMIVSVVANPVELRTLTDLTNMQDINSKICANTPPETSTQLKDTRDNKWYWVTKLKDGNCWMTQNLDWDIPATVDATVAAQSDNIPAGWSPSEATRSGALDLTDFGNNATSYSWDPGDLVINNPANSIRCNTIPAGDVLSNATCNRVDSTVAIVGDTIPSDVKNNMDLHYHLGNYYQWPAATADTGNDLTVKGDDAVGSVCPKGWQLPQDANSTAEVKTATYRGLVNAYSIGSNNADRLTLEPLYFIRGGGINSKGYDLIGSSNYCWTSTTNSSSSSAYDFVFYGLSIPEVFSDSRSIGESVRCVTR